MAFAEWESTGSVARVLLIEDDVSSHNVLRKLLIRLGCEVASATTVAEGLDLLAREPDCVVLDLMLPDGEGETILRKIRAERLPIRVAVTTGEGNLERLRRVRELGPEVLIRKPIQMAELVRGLSLPCEL